MHTPSLMHLGAALALAAQLCGAQAAVTIDLADQPLANTVQVPGNLALDLSVEFPTAVSVAHINSTYNSADTYLGYFDPDRCYLYKFVRVESTSEMTHFAPAGLASAHQCTGNNDHLWSGNYLNWAATQTIDPLRWTMTGGYRVVDIPSLTLLEKAWATGQGGTNNFPDRVLGNNADITGATPFSGGATSLTAAVQGRGQKASFTANGSVGTGGFLATYFDGTNLDYDPTPKAPVLTRMERTIDYTNNFFFSNWPRAQPSQPFSARWVESTTVPTTGTYVFRTTSDDGVRLWVNGVKMIDQLNARRNATVDVSPSVQLTAGQPLNIELEYTQAGGDGRIFLEWLRPGNFVFSTYTAADTWTPPIRVKVCDPNAPGGLESNCVGYANGNYKPEGLMQKYASKIRYSVFGYLNDSNVLRDGGVLRTAQKFVGPTYPVPGSALRTNPAAEWDANTGVFFTNPDSGDAAATNNAFGTAVSNSGAINYINKFGQITPGTAKQFDPVSELYYASLRYYKNKGNISSWSNMDGADANTRRVWTDGFPVITSWTDPIQYACQRNFILGVGDVNTNADKNVPGPTGNATEPAKPGGADGLMGDTSYTSAFNAVTATNKVGALQGMGPALGSAVNVGGCCNDNSALIAGLAYDANTRDIRTDLVGKQTVQTYWVDVLEYSTYKPNNQFYLAAKYGGFTVPDGFDPYTRTAALPEAWWRTNSETVGGGADTQPRPDNYFTGGRPDLLVSGLTKAFASIADNLRPSNSTALATGSPNLLLSGAGYGSSYNPKSWTGSVTGALVSYDTADGIPKLTPKWDAGALLDAQSQQSPGLVATRTVITCCKTTGVALPFNTTAMAAGGLSARTYYDSFAKVPGVTSASQSAPNFLNYLRGDRRLEQGNAGGVYRKRDHVMGDIVDSKILPVSAPELPYFDDTNPGYSAFKKAYRDRKTVVYAGANDGKLHAIDGDVPTDNSASTGGSELFAYIPSFTYGTPDTFASTGLAALGNPNYGHSFRVNGPLQSGDVNFNQTFGVTGSGAALASGDWRSVLVGGLGKGGKGYFALDITNPKSWSAATPALAEAAATKALLWEFPAAPELASVPNHPLASSARAASTMGYSFGAAQITKTAKYGWVALLTSGYNNADGKGYLYVVDIRTGALLETVVTPEGSVDAPINLAQVTGYVPDPRTGLVEAAYGADLRGNVWRFDLRGTAGAYSTPTKIAVLSGPSGAAQGVTTPVRIAIDPATGNKRFILVGTGRLLADSDAGNTDTQSFYALVDGDANQFFVEGSNGTLPAGFTFPLTRKSLSPITDVTSGAGNVVMGWYIDLRTATDAASEPAYRVTISPVYYQGYLAFAANQPSGDACAPQGKGRLYEVSLGSGKRVSFTQNSSFYLDIAYQSFNGKVKLTSSTADGPSKSGDERTEPIRAGRVNWREAPANE